jgi:hypothetical protein
MVLGNAGIGHPRTIDHAIGCIDPRKWMNEHQMGFWSFMVTYIGGAYQNAPLDDMLGPLRILWLADRERDTTNLVSRYGCKCSGVGVRNASVATTVEVFDDELIALIMERDGHVLAKMRTLPQGVKP